MGLEYHWEWVFYKYIAPTALGFTSKQSSPLENSTRFQQFVSLSLSAVN
jgi:hypothetical protein